MPDTSTLRIIAVDLSHLYRARWEAAAGKSSQGQEAFTATVQAVVEARAGYDRVAICCDSGPSFRRTIAPTYKAHRERPPAAFYAQQDRAIERLAADACSVFRAPQYPPLDAEVAFYFEADDVIGALCSWANGAGHHVTILGGDKDLLALVSDAGVDVIRPDSPPPLLPGDTSPAATWGAEAVRASPKIGVLPALVPAWLALCGDDSDGIEGFCGWVDPPAKEGEQGAKHPGIGEKTAAKLLGTFGDLAGIFAALDTPAGEEPKIKGHVAEVLRRHGWARAALGLDLATIRRDVPLDFSPLLAEPEQKPIAGPEPFDDGDGMGESVEPPVAPAKGSKAIEIHRPASLAIDPSHPDWALALQPRDAAEAWQMSKHFYDSKLFVKFGSVAAIWTVMMLGREYGLSAITSLQSIHMIDGKPEMAADMIAALVLRSGKAKRFAPVILEAERVVYEVQRFDDPEPLRVEFTKAHAMARGLWGRGAWAKMPEVMLEHRCATKGARLKFPDVVRNLYGSGEISEARMVEAEFMQ